MMSDKLAERVLVVPTERFHSMGLFQGLCQEVSRYLPALLDPQHLSFRPRSEVETDPSFKQIIPYVVLRHEDRVFYYTRGKQGTEERLQALKSIGIGGHISEEDAEGDDLYRCGMLREVEEEVNLQSEYTEYCLGLINDDSTPVGAVHLGIVHVFDLEQPKVSQREESLAEIGFATLEELAEEKDTLETWSQFTLEALR